MKGSITIPCQTLGPLLFYGVVVSTKGSTYLGDPRFQVSASNSVASRWIDLSTLLFGDNEMIFSLFLKRIGSAFS